MMSTTEKSSISTASVSVSTGSGCVFDLATLEQEIAALTPKAPNRDSGTTPAPLGRRCAAWVRCAMKSASGDGCWPRLKNWPVRSLRADDEGSPPSSARSANFRRSRAVRADSTFGPYDSSDAILSFTRRRGSTLRTGRDAPVCMCAGRSGEV